MGSLFEINDTLKISIERGFPSGLTLEAHTRNPDSSRRFIGRPYSFWNTGERLYHRPPTRVFLVEERHEGKWLYWGHALVFEQTIRNGRTSGQYQITKIYDPAYQHLVTMHEAPEGKAFFT